MVEAGVHLPARHLRRAGTSSCTGRGRHRLGGCSARRKACRFSTGSRALPRVDRGGCRARRLRRAHRRASSASRPHQIVSRKLRSLALSLPVLPRLRLNTTEVSDECSIAKPRAALGAAWHFQQGLRLVLAWDARWAVGHDRLRTIFTAATSSTTTPDRRPRRRRRAQRGALATAVAHAAAGGVDQHRDEQRPHPSPRLQTGAEVWQ